MSGRALGLSQTRASWTRAILGTQVAALQGAFLWSRGHPNQNQSLWPPPRPWEPGSSGIVFFGDGMGSSCTPHPHQIMGLGAQGRPLPSTDRRASGHISQAVEGAGARGLALLSGRMGRAPTWAAGEVWGSGRWAVASRPSSRSVVRGFRGVQPPPSSTPNHKGGWCKALWHRDNEAQSGLAGMNPRPSLASSPHPSRPGPSQVQYAGQHLSPRLASGEP